MTTRRRLTAAVAGALLATVLAACGSPAGAPHRSPSAAAPSQSPSITTRPASTPALSPSTPAPVGTAIPTDVPMTGPNLTAAGETPPVMPAAALAHTQEGALAFAEFFIRTIDWGYASVSSTYMRHYSTDACTICAGLADAIDGIAQKGYHVAGNRFDSASSPTVAQTPLAGAEVTVDVPVIVSAGEVVDGAGRFVQGQPSLRLTEIVGVAFASGRWAVVAMGATR